MTDDETDDWHDYDPYEPADECDHAEADIDLVTGYLSCHCGLWRAATTREVEARPRDRPVLTPENEAGLKLCIASAWLYGSISRGRAAELARAMGWPFSAIENLKFVEERNRFTEADFDAQQKTPQPEGQGVD